MFEDDEDDDTRERRSDGYQYPAMMDLVHYINTNERPVEQFRAAMVFMLSMLAIDPDDLNEALCKAFSQFEENTVARRQAQALQVVDKAAKARGVKGKPKV